MVVTLELNTAKKGGYFMQESVQENNNRQSKTKRNSSKKSTQSQNLCLTLPQLSTFDVKDLGKYWNQRSEGIHSRLWLPIETDSQGAVSDLSNGLCHYQVEKLNHLTRVLKPTTSILKNLSVLLPASATPIMGSIQHGTKKIRIYPQNERKFMEAIHLYRRAYNLAVALFISDKWRDKDGKSINMRPQIKKICKSEQDKDSKAYNAIIVDSAVLKAKETFFSVIKANKKNKTSSRMSFKSRKDKTQTLTFDRLSKNKEIAVKALEGFYAAEEIPDETIGKSCSVTYSRGRWYIQVLVKIDTKAEIQGKVKVIAVDPGVRTFATTYSQNEVIEFGSEFARKKLLPLALKYRKLLSFRQRLLNLKSEEKWVQERLVSVNRKLDKLENNKQDLVLDLHHRVAYHLVTNYDVIFLPKFETKKMTFKKDRKINRTTTKSMLDLSHYKFKLLINWYAKKYGKHIVDCNESYTSKTRSWDGTVDDKLGSKEAVKDERIKVKRDVNAARGILIKQLSMAA